MASIIELAYLSDSVYYGVNCGSWKVSKEKIKDRFRAALYKNGEEKVVAFSGSDQFADWRIDNHAIIRGKIPPQAVSAIEFFANDVNEFGEKFNSNTDFYNWDGIREESNIMVVGHSLGGALAAIVANKFQAKAVTFNAPGINALENEDFDDEHAILWDTHFSVTIKPSPLAGEKISNYIIMEDLTGDVRKHIGKVYYARADRSIFSAHYISQWLIEERYDGEGNFAPYNKINLGNPEDLLNAIP